MSGNQKNAGPSVNTHSTDAGVAKEFSPVTANTVADRIRRANEEIVPAHSHTSASLKMQQNKDAISQEADDGKGPGGLGKRGKKISEPGIPSTSDVGKLDENARANMSKFLSGFQRFHKRFFADNTSLFSNLQHGQAPKTLLIGCCDSRCDPAIITDCDPGDLFVIRNVANIVPPYIPNDMGTRHGTSAAMEFAIKALKVQSIIVMGHTSCGGIRALLSGSYAGCEFIEAWMGIAQQAKDTTLNNFGHLDFDHQARVCEQASIICSLENLVSYPWIKDKLSTGEISVNGWFFDFKAGDLLAYNPDTAHFQSLTALAGGRQAGESKADLLPDATVTESTNPARQAVGAQ
ncbi:carbonic anhydrase [Phlyctochytrium arcticum]|nr:carbonic anhydrase [Phlyctochytrium arcticum]